MCAATDISILGRGNVVISFVVLAARTEQHGVACLSMQTSVIDGYPAGDQFDLRVANDSVVGFHIEDIVSRQIKVMDQIPEHSNFGRNKAERAINIRSVAVRIYVRFFRS